MGESEGVLLRKVAAHKWWKERVNGGGCDSVGKEAQIQRGEKRVYYVFIVDCTQK